MWPSTTAPVGCSSNDTSVPHLFTPLSLVFFLNKAIIPYRSIDLGFHLVFFVFLFFCGFVVILLQHVVVVIFLWRVVVLFWYDILF